MLDDIINRIVTERPHQMSVNKVSYCIILYCIVLYCIVLYCIVLYCIAMDWSAAALSEEMH